MTNRDPEPMGSVAWVDGHASDGLLASYAAGTVETIEVWSVEAHLTGCGRCRSAVSAHVDAGRLARNRSVLLSLAALGDGGHSRWVRRLLGRCGLPDYLLDLIAATPSLRVSWLLSVVGVMAVVAGEAAAVRYGLIGGGYPVAAFGGRADIMALLDPVGGRPPIPQSGTFNGNPVGMVAGAATLEALTPGAYDRLNAMGDDLRQRLTATFARRGVRAQVTGMGSLLNLHFTDTAIVDYRTMRTGDLDRLQRVFFGLLNEGIYLAPRGMACLSTPMGQGEIDAFVRATERALAV